MIKLTLTLDSDTQNDDTIITLLEHILISVNYDNDIQACGKLETDKDTYNVVNGYINKGNLTNDHNLLE